MPITEKIDKIPYELTHCSSNLRGACNRDPGAMYRMREMSHHMHNTPSSTYAWGSWGWTILRTVYDKESDALFPAAIEKLRRWVVGYWIHYGRFCGFGEPDIARAEKKADGSVNDALGERLRFEVLEDRERLNMPDLGKTTAEDIQTLCNRFHKWVASVGEDPDTRPPADPRLVNFVVVDAESLRALASVPENVLPHGVAADREEFIRRRYSPCYAGYAWLVDHRAVKLYREGVQVNPRRRGWMKIGSEQLDDAWSQLVGLLMMGDGGAMIECSDSGEGSGEFWYSDSVF
ncbi:hypothetical protein C8A01DRAFT_18573 [Parachaetomium inaequale]|uniref:Uncharacterized protein n=1 Tax=Parachaetomium inaequale TaxID=2588326 RepID=A0AAN6PAD5_9PEZI|nr:hypothetical protein C8A01DRAFT_18573 [Parachaetomium inaequale]